LIQDIELEDQKPTTFTAWQNGWHPSNARFGSKAALGAISAPMSGDMARRFMSTRRVVIKRQADSCPINTQQRAKADIA
jgi:hypothetical protein